MEKRTDLCHNHNHKACRSSDRLLRMRANNESGGNTGDANLRKRHYQNASQIGSNCQGLRRGPLLESNKATGPLGGGGGEDRPIREPASGQGTQALFMLHRLKDQTVWLIGRAWRYYCEVYAFESHRGYPYARNARTQFGLKSAAYIYV